MKHPAIDADDSHVAVRPTGAVEQHAVGVGDRCRENQGGRSTVAQVTQGAGTGVQRSTSPSQSTGTWTTLGEPSAPTVTRKQALPYSSRRAARSAVVTGMLMPGSVALGMNKIFAYIFPHEPI